MAKVVETTLRGPEAYGLARRVLDEMEAAGVWPTPVNFELWLHHLGEPEGPLGQEIRRILAAGEPFTDAVSDMLAAEYLPRGRLSEEIRDAGRVLDRELNSVATAIATAHRSQNEYGQVLAGASADMDKADSPDNLRAVVDGLTTATRKVQKQNADLEKRLDVSTREVAKLREHLEQVRRDAMTDALTNLANRKAFDEHLEASVESAHRDGRELVLAVVDIDHFKRFNDTWGHQTGDQVIRYVASVLARLARSPRMAARYGGEEFAVVFPNEDAAAVEAALESVRTEIASRSLRRRSTDDELGAVTISAGYARLARDETASALIGRADEALYASKHAGRNRVTSAETTRRAAA
ncbi:MAG: GGDEF domain-containing protein [Alphaproteobacteria bacterium]|nr:GGDEF domain-containing protein [Alphaproteobacteria bacterium]MBU1526319.1 GGDEF domain-containing protein [Alphaproteobacteria bacterium]MBU2116238.1 GGDEF domain-containing protein [Alphaproteobacteria bacterium]MBU2351793.1 GGDEF domain-containing protein [Alphaproteobacteria bacterium]MBU2382059.1 GGDEF domain-containing protein [Alphaproteobacteria bacterium]